LGDDADSYLRTREGSVLDGKWTLERLLGSGGMAAVYSARHRNGARAAVKILHPEFAKQTEVRERFLREGYAANQVEHPGAVRVLDDDVIAEGPGKGTAYIVMELLEGESLQDRLERGPQLDEIEFLRIADSVLEVLDAAHARGVIHRDLKPENLFLARSENGSAPPQVKILDFGLARLLQNQTITTYGLALGTPSFMSPEQAAGRIDEIDGRTDLFALAATGFRLRTGRRIHEADNPVELVTKMASLPAPRVGSAAPDVSEPFARVIDRALAFKRDDRYATAAAMRRDVRRAIAQLEAGGQMTQFAVPSSLRPTTTGGSAAQVGPDPSTRTIDLSESDIEVTVEEEEGPREQLESPLWPQLDDSIHIPRRRLAPWLALVAIAIVGVIGVVGLKRWWGARSAAVASAPVHSPSASPSASAATLASVAMASATAKADPPEATASSTESAAAAPSPPAPSPTPAAPVRPATTSVSAKAPAAPATATPVATHRKPPSKAGPASGHKTTKKRHTTGHATTTQGH
jgi:serine/threonine-protein kinase